MILQTNISRGGIPKKPIPRARVTRAGIDGDAFAHPRIHGGPSQAILLIANEVLEDLASQGVSVFPGALGENLTTVGLDHRGWRSGQIYRAGSARIEFTTPRAPCRTLEIYDSGRSGPPLSHLIFDAGVRRGDISAAAWGRSGFYARVIQDGEIAAGDAIVLEP